MEFQSTTTEEEWRDIEGWPHYQVSDLGRVRCLPHVAKRKDRWGGIGDYPVSGGLRKLQKHAAVNRHGKKRPAPPAQIVTVRLNGKHVTKYVHHLVLIAFVGPRPEGMEACHNDGDPFNNQLSNLRWDSHASNVLDSIRHKTFYPRREYGDYQPRNEQCPI